VYPEYVQAAQPLMDLPGNPNSKDRVVLLAEDSDFFRNQIRAYLESDGYTVLTAADGQEALELLLTNYQRVSLVLTDIEMPRMDGLEFTLAIRSDPRTAALPIIALTSLAGEDDISRGLAAGVNQYQIKLDRDNLLEGIRTIFEPGIPSLDPEILGMKPEGEME
jgi:two-component system, chemotaxis family, sensor kinase CheA